MKTTPLMDRQVMDLSNQRSKDFNDLLNPPQADDHCAGNEINVGGIDPYCDFHSIIPIGFSSYTQSSMSDNLSNLSKTWNSAELSESNSTSTPILNHISLDSVDPLKVNSKADQLFVDARFVAQIDRTMKNHVDNLMHGLDQVGARITQLESRTRSLECSLDELKETVENNHGSTQGIMWQFENLLREVQSGVNVLNDMQEEAGAKMQISKLQVSKIDLNQQSESHSSSNSISENQMPYGPKTSPHPHHSSSSIYTPNAPLQPPSQQSLPSAHFSNQFPQNQLLSVSPLEPYFPLPAPSQEVSNLLYKVPQIEQGHPSPSQNQQHPIHASIHPPYLPPSSVNLAEKTQYLPLHDFQSILNKPPYQPSSRPSSSQHGTAKSMFETSPEFPGPNDLHNYVTDIKPPNLPSAASERPITRRGYWPSQPPLPHALPTAAEVIGGSNSGSAGTGNRVPVSDVVDKVTSMGFSRERVRVAVRKLTENGQLVDLNVVLDKLMKDEVQTLQARGWFGR